jgi:cell division protein ZapD
MALNNGYHLPYLQFFTRALFVILYEHPFNERIRTYLRLEYLLGRFEHLLLRSSEIDHHFALTTLFEIIDVGGRSDLKSDILKELERHKQQFSSYRGNPSVSEAVLDELLGNIERCLQGFNTQAARLSQCVTESDFLSSLRNRVAVPGGTCAFDLPGYHAWQQRDPDLRRHRYFEMVRAFENFARQCQLVDAFAQRKRFPAARGGQPRSVPTSLATRAFSNDALVH